MITYFIFTMIARSHFRKLFILPINLVKKRNTR